MTPLSPEEKLKIYKKLESNVAMGMAIALDVFNDLMGNMVEGKKQEFLDIIGKLNTEIKTLQLKDGKTPEKGKDYFTKKDVDEVVNAAADKARPQKGKDYFTPEDIESLKSIFIALLPPKEKIITKDEVSALIKKEVDSIELPSFEASKTPEEITAQITETVKAILAEQKPSEINIEAIVAGINGLAIRPELQIDASHIKNLPQNKKTKEKTGGRVGGGGDIVMMEDLSTLTNGTLKVFTVPYNRKSVMVVCSDFPSVLFENNGYTLNAARTQLTLTVTNAPSSGSQLGFQYVL